MALRSVTQGRSGTIFICSGIVGCVVSPYLFVIIDCDLQGEFRAFQGEKDIPPNTKLYEFNTDIDLSDNDATARDRTDCIPVKPYPNDYWTL